MVGSEAETPKLAIRGFLMQLRWLPLEIDDAVTCCCNNDHRARTRPIEGDERAPDPAAVLRRFRLERRETPVKPPLEGE